MFHQNCRTWSVPSHIPLPTLYLRRVAPNGAQHREGREAALTEAGPKALPAPLTEKYSGYDLTVTIHGKWLRLSTVDLAWLSGRAINIDASIILTK